jgi:hypothetical protein
MEGWKWHDEKGTGMEEMRVKVYVCEWGRLMDA